MFGDVWPYFKLETVTLLRLWRYKSFKSRAIMDFEICNKNDPLL